MVTDFNLMLTFFLRNREVPWAPFLQRTSRNILGRKEGDQPPFCAQDVSWTRSREGGLEGQIPMQGLVNGSAKCEGLLQHPAGSTSSVRDTVFYCFSSLLLTLRQK